MRRQSLLATLTVAALGLTAATHGAETFKVDASHSTVEYRVKHLNVSYSIGRFNSIEGTFNLDPADPAQNAFEFTVKTDSLDSANASRDGHLKGPDFFNAKQFPKIAFKSKSVTSAGENAYEVKGDLTLHGVTKEVTVKIEQTGSGPGMRGGKLAGLLSEFTIKRSDFGMKNMVGPIGDDVKITVAIEGGHN